ncbi:hypothetical protein B9T24_14210 [Acinetobacter sp. ANC 4654]|uniref:hypothetical protein n=1 Tax=Acinetobacter sp. ANC 4654 TaxID=1977872 RepID=UPI000A32C4D0|nr:hypothetical protein [Acinetobacter sp. ANC 4654]OTG93619.1 hypothetical protein B9T24_14210 [Acinetobacter sp. ANC 4654]
MMTQIIKQTLTPTQVFEALAKGFKMEFAEVDTNDWELLTPQTRLGFADLFSGFIKFRFAQTLDEGLKRAQKAQSEKYFSECVGLDGDKNERYRIGKYPSFYVLKPSGRSGINLDGFSIYKESQGNLTPVDKDTVSDLIINALITARKAKRNTEYYDLLNKTGHFQSDDYKQWAKTHR